MPGSFKPADVVKTIVGLVPTVSGVKAAPALMPRFLETEAMFLSGVASSVALLYTVIQLLSPVDPARAKTLATKGGLTAFVSACAVVAMRMFWTQNFGNWLDQALQFAVVFFYSLFWGGLTMAGIAVASRFTD